MVALPLGNPGPFGPIDVLSADIPSWGRVRGPRRRRLDCFGWDHVSAKLREADAGPVLAGGAGRSYGDVGIVTEGGLQLDTRACDALQAFDRERGLLRAEAGVRLAALLPLLDAAGWRLPVVPGTAEVTLGGAVANDVHGKNQHRVGAFGRHVTALELARSDGYVTCSPTRNAELHAATVGGLGLTGLITSVEIQLQLGAPRHYRVQRRAFDGWKAFLALCRAEEADDEFTHTVAWADAGTLDRRGLRGYWLRGVAVEAAAPGGTASRLTLPRWTPALARSRLLVGGYNRWHGWRHRRPADRVEEREAFLHPLDRLRGWNRLYGRAGLLQYQCLLPWSSAEAAGQEFWKVLAADDERPHLCVLNHFGAVPSVGLLSFCRPGISIALDFPHRGASTLRLLAMLDKIVMAAGGRLYAAKDARTSADTFRAMYPEAERLAAWRDPIFVSSLADRLGL